MVNELSVPVSERDHIQGQATAAITLVQYGDYECPYTAHSLETVHALQREFGDRLRFVYRNFPLRQIHPHAQHAAEATEAAGAQDMFWEMHDYLFRHQKTLTDADLVRCAQTFGLNMLRFEQDLAQHTYAGRIQEDVISGENSGVQGTPTFFINGSRYEVAWDIDTMRTALLEHTSRR